MHYRHDVIRVSNICGFCADTDMGKLYAIIAQPLDDFVLELVLLITHRVL